MRVAAALAILGGAPLSACTDPAPVDAGRVDAGAPAPRDAGGTPAPDAGGSPDAGAPADGGDAVAPRVLSTDPPDGRLGERQRPVTIVFSEAMDEASVAAAYPDARSISWSSPREVVLDIELPFEPTPSTYAFTVPDTVTDLAGNPLESPYVASIGLLGVISVTLLPDAGLTGHRHAAGGGGTFLRAGDDGGARVAYGGVTFDMSPLPARDATLGLLDARFRTHVVGVGGDPSDPSMGPWTIDHVEYAGMSGLPSVAARDAAFASPWTGAIGPGTVVDVDVTSQLDASWTDGAARFQLRLQPGSATDNGTADFVYLRRRADENDGIVDPSLPDPDPANQARVELRYYVE